MSAVKVSFYAKNEHPVFNIEFRHPKTREYMGYTVYNNSKMEQKTENGIAYSISFVPKSKFNEDLAVYFANIMSELGFDVKELLVKREKYDYLY